MQKLFTWLSLVAIVFVSIASSVHAESYVEHHVDHVQHADHDHDTGSENAHEPCESSCSTNSCVHSLLLLSSHVVSDFLLNATEVDNKNIDKLASSNLKGLFKPPIS